MAGSNRVVVGASGKPLECVGIGRTKALVLVADRAVTTVKTTTKTMVRSILVVGEVIMMRVVVDKDLGWT